MRLKTCGICKTEKSISEFYRRSKSKDGFDYRCKLCDRSQFCKWRSENSDRSKAKMREYYANNSDELKAKMVEYRQANPSKMSALKARYKAKKRKATPKWANQAAIELFYEEAEFCTEFFGIPYHVDHMVPIQSPLVCGLHWEGNLQVLTEAENLAKGNRWWPDMP